MKLSHVIKRAEKISRRHRVTDGDAFRLKQHDPGDTGGFGKELREEAATELREGIEALAVLQDRLYAADRWAALFVIQAMDAAGKDSTIKHVMSGINPQGCQVAAFKTPTSAELDHDYLWRAQRELPPRGRIGIFNRSYYEEVLIVRVHPEFLAGQRLPDGLVGPDIWEERFRQIRQFERHLAENGTRTVKFFLHVSKGEQKRRFLARIDQPEKNWKFSAGDLKERALWKEYQSAYEEMIRNTATKASPWYVVPSDHKWYTQLVVGAAMVAALADLDPRYPELPAAKRAELAACKKSLLAEK